MPGGEAQLVRRAKVTLLTVLAALYILAVLLLERVIMPRYVYRPIRTTLDADKAALEGDRDREIIAAVFPNRPLSRRIAIFTSD